MYAPHVFHGTSGEVTVPESSTARLSTSGASPRRSNSSRNIRLGRTSATYWSPAVTFRLIALAFTARIRLPARPRPRHDRQQKPVEEPGVLEDRRETPSRRARATPSSGGSPCRRVRRARRPPRRRCGSRSPSPSPHRPHESRSRRSLCCGSSTNALTASHCVKHARMPANSADPRMARNGGTFLTVKTTSSASGSRLSAEMWKALSRRLERLVRADLAAPTRLQPDEQEDHEG